MKNKKPGDENPFGEDEILSLASKRKTDLRDIAFRKGVQCGPRVDWDGYYQTLAATAFKNHIYMFSFERSLTNTEREWFK